MKKLILLIMLLPIFASAGDYKVSIYRGLATTHLFMDNSYLNNDNSVTILKIQDILVGTMTNSYGESGRLLGYQPKVYQRGSLELYAGLTLVDGYKRWQVPLSKSTPENQFDNVVAALPIASVAWRFTENFSLQLNNMVGVVFNAGVRLDF